MRTCPTRITAMTIIDTGEKSCRSVSLKIPHLIDFTPDLIHNLNIFCNQ
jgi:hypothetical protein